MLTVIQVGHDAASDRYIRSKKNAVEQAGMTVEIVNLPKEATTDDVQQAITDAACLAEDCCAILVQLPLPEHIDRERVLKWIPKTMDIDGLNPASGWQPLTPCAIMRWLRENEVRLAGKNVVLFGKSELVGKPLALMLMDAGATVTICGSRTSEKFKRTACYAADIIISAVGKAGAVTDEHVAKCLEPKIVIDVGINRDAKGRLCGDVSPLARRLVEENGGVCTPVPGGVGKWTVNELILRLKEMEEKAKER